jgi:hypothetical protein
MMENKNACNKCGKNLNQIEIEDGNSMCMRCELVWLREYRARDIKHTQELVGSPVYKKFMNRKHTIGCKLNFI